MSDLAPRRTAPRRLGARLALGATSAASSIAAVVFVAFAVAWGRHPYEAVAAFADVIAVLLIIVSVTCAALYGALTWLYRTDSARPSTRTTGPTLNTSVIIRDSHSFDFTEHESSALELFKTMVVAPQSVIDRVVESIHPMSRSTLVRTTFSVRLPQLRSSVVTIPLFVQPRGLLESGMRFMASDEQELAPYSQHHSLAAVLATIRYFIEQEDLDHIRGYTVSLEEQAAVAIATGIEPHLRDEWTRSFAESLAEMCPNVSESGRQQIAPFVGALLGDTVTCVDIEVPHSMHKGTLARVTVERRILGRDDLVGQEGHLPTGTARFAAFWRSWLGIFPTQVVFPLVGAARASSYHVEVEGPPGTYLLRQQVLDLRDLRPLSLDGENYAFTPRRGQRHSHFMIRRVNSAERMVLCNDFVERSPGSVGSALLSSLAACFLIWLCAETSLRPAGSIATRAGELHPSDLIAILLAFPVVIAIWAGFDRPDKVSDALLSRVSKVLTIVLCIIAASYYVVGTVGFGDPQANAAWQWITVACLSSVNAVVALFAWALQALVHGHFVNRRGRD